ncbi:hypothetical protein Tco_0893942 [Tanacetum coccineum]|uniref:Uncharacterized protein n=1 Tax=Tanacetum coccineum TaxID=301880 RepID=A0ABQ5CAQ7_9ASTR
MITTTSRIEDKKLLGLILPKHTMETSLCVQYAPYITQEFALSSVEFATRHDKLQILIADVVLRLLDVFAMLAACAFQSESTHIRPLVADGILSHGLLAEFDVL